MKTHHLVRRSALALLAASALGASLPALAQGKITRLVVAFPSGGPVDFVARTIGEQLGKELGHQVIVKTRPVPTARLRRTSSRVPCLMARPCG